MILWGDGDEAITLGVLAGAIGLTSVYVGKASVGQARAREKQPKQTAVLNVVPGYNPDRAGWDMRIYVSIGI
jgi:hypothetical protein